MGYGEHLRELLRPLGIYDLTSGAGGGELTAAGAAMDDLGAALELTERESILPTAEDGGLSAYEAVLPYTPEYLTLADRRRAIMALLRIDGGSFTVSALCDTLAGCGLRAVAEETDAASTVRVYFPYNRGVPGNFDALKTRIQAILPCHLAVEYSIVYLTWAELETAFASWSALSAACGSWDALEKYAPAGEVS
jgi:hypothetical protein